MKTIKTCITFLILVFSISTYADGHGHTAGPVDNHIMIIHAVKVEGYVQASELVETKFMKRLAQHAIDNGDLVGWNFFRAYQNGGINDEDNFTHMFVSFYKDIDSFFDPQFWTKAGEVLTKKEQKELASLQSKYSWSKDTMVMYRVDASFRLASGPEEFKDGYVQLNYAKPTNAAAFLQENREIWKDFHLGNAPKSNMVSWGTGQKIHPTGGDWASVMTFDMFKSLPDLMKYRMGIGVTSWPENSKMGEINPNGFQLVAVGQFIDGAAAKK